MFSIFKGLVGSKALTKEDLEPVIAKLRDNLIDKVKKNLLQRMKTNKLATN